MTRAVGDFAFAVRMLRRRPAFTALAVATLGLGIGAATTIYSVVDGVLLEPLPYHDSARLVAIYRTFPRWRDQEGLKARWDHIWFSYPVYRDWQARQTSFASVGAWAPATRTLTGIDAAEQVSIIRATSSLLRTLDVRPALGRYFLPGEDTPPGTSVAVLSHEAWTTRFGASPAVLGRTVRLDGVPYEIVGVLPEGLDLGSRGRPEPIWIPAGGDAGDARAGNTAYLAVGRLRGGVSLARASDEARRLLADSDPTERAGARLDVWQQEVTRRARRPLLLLLGASVLLLVLACVNLAMLLLGEATGRTTEFATRAALGAGPRRVGRQLLVESLVLAAAGVVAGVLVARFGLTALVALAPSDIPRLAGVGLDGRVLLATCAAAAVTALAFGLGPAVWLMRTTPGSLLGAANRATRRHERWTLRALVALQVALSTVLLVAAALLGRSLHRLGTVDPGFASDRLVLIGLGVIGSHHAEAEEATTAFFVQAAERIAALPGVERAAVGSAVPFSGGGSSNVFGIEGQPLPPGSRGVEARRSNVLPGFIETLGLRLLAGRTIDSRDRAGAADVALVNETLARRYWPTESAIGKRVKLGDAWITIVGVVSDVKHASLGDTTRVTVYLPAAQVPTPYLSIIVRSSIGAATLTPMVRRAVAALDPAVPVTRVDAVADLVNRSFASDRFRAVLLGVFAALAAVLASIGIYGVTARAVARQQREIGIRMAFGAPARRVVALFVGRTGVAAALGMLAGLAGAFAVSRVLAPYLFATSPVDAASYALAAVLLMCAALTAAWIPARRATRTPAASVLRET